MKDMMIFGRLSLHRFQDRKTHYPAKHVENTRLYRVSYIDTYNVANSFK